ncbi:MAG TPA: type VI secretion system contractile sheath large subunit [Myxococcota bacterium]|nr:type VI secretion system contractile sheath large subunit [Myxococcota bacterium]
MTAGRGFVVGVLANLSGRAGGRDPREHLARARLLDIDRDDFDALLARLCPRLALGLPDCAEIAIPSFEAFHPDALAARIPTLAKLLEARDAVRDPSRVESLLQEAGASEMLATVTPKGTPAPGRAFATESELLDSLLQEPSAASPAPRLRPGVDSEFDRLVREIADASADRTDYALLERWRAAIDRELSRRVRRVLHHSGFQRLEATWRGLRDLIYHAETGDDLRLRVLNIACEDLQAELEAESALETTTLFQLLVEKEKGTPGGEPFDLLVADFTIERKAADLRLLRHLARVAERAEAPLVAEVGHSLWEPALRGEPITDEAWCELKGAEEARWIALACPRVLLRLPYGRDLEYCERFAFEEEVSPERPYEYLWGNPVWLVARAACAALVGRGSLAAVGDFAGVDGLPIHVQRLGNETIGFGPTERLFTDRELERMGGVGLVTLAAARGGDSLRIMPLQSVAGFRLPARR